MTRCSRLLPLGAASATRQHCDLRRVVRIRLRRVVRIRLRRVVRIRLVGCTLPSVLLLPLLHPGAGRGCLE
jgi:hypothetical protein